ncbi:hypothetical protein ACT3QR_10485 [Psychrobacter sp. AOP7-B1-25]|uniref:hypothetical protein n=1 Tax=Psychrobacter sp. AOP7-B1-25 TaxID=3457644 RepID=UPI00402B3D44
MMDEEEYYLQEIRIEYERKSFFLHHNLGAEVHWLFTQALSALDSELYLPACTSFINGIEASLRVTMSQITKPCIVTELDNIPTLSNSLLLAAQNNGLPIEALAFPKEKMFLNNLNSKKPNKTDVEIVRIRNNLCHGNFLEYTNTNLGEGNHFFTPECCRPLAHQLHELSREWTVHLGKFRKELIEKSYRI